jgi:hypothetical protein
MMLAERVGVIVVVVVLVIVVVDVKVVRARVVVVRVLVTVITRGQLAGLTQPPGQTWLSAIWHWREGGLIVQIGRWASTNIGMAANSAAIMNLICRSKSCDEDQQNPEKSYLELHVDECSVLFLLNFKVFCWVSNNRRASLSILICHSLT